MFVDNGFKIFLVVDVSGIFRVFLIINLDKIFFKEFFENILKLKDRRSFNT